MGRIANSFKSQIGRDAGKVFSNWIWGDKHSTPYRRVSGSDNGKSRQKRYKVETEILESNHQFEIEQKKQQQVLELQKEVCSRINTLAQMPIPKKKEQLIETLQQVSILMYGNPWASISGDNEELNAAKNQYADALYGKYGQCLYALQLYYPKCAEIFVYQGQLQNYQKQRRHGKYSSTVLYISLFVVLTTIIGIMAYFEEKEKKQQSEIVNSVEDFFHKLSE